MSGASCHFCAHRNPTGSKFCNECGSPLDLKPCPHCEAMNHVGVDRCYQCASAFAIDTDREVVEMGIGASRATAFAPKPAAGAPTTSDTIPVAFSEHASAEGRKAAPQEPYMAGAGTQARDSVDGELPSPFAAPRTPAPRTEAAIDMQRAQAVRAYRVPRKGFPYAALALVVLCAIGAGGYYYAYESGTWSRIIAAVRSRVDHGGSNAQLAAPAGAKPPGQAVAREGAPQADSSLPASPMNAPAASASPTAVAPTPPSAPMAPTTLESTPAAVVSPATNATDSARATGATPENSARATGATPETVDAPAAASASAPSHAPSATPAPARPSRAARARSAPVTRTSPPSSTASTAQQSAEVHVDRDALATQRLIERDLAGFLPPGRSPDSTRARP